MKRDQAKGISWKISAFFCHWKACIMAQLQKTRARVFLLLRHVVVYLHLLGFFCFLIVTEFLFQMSESSSNTCNPILNSSFKNSMCFLQLFTGLLWADLRLVYVS